MTDFKIFILWMVGFISGAFIIGANNNFFSTYFDLSNTQKLLVIIFTMLGNLGLFGRLTEKDKNAI